METENNAEQSLKTANQDILIKKLLKSRSFKDKEFKLLKKVYDKQVLTSYDASILIAHLLATLRFRRTFLNEKHKAYKRCLFCGTRENVERYHDLTNDSKAWVCENCAMNLDSTKIVRTKIQEDNEVKSDLYKKYDHHDLTSVQEDLICEHKEQ